MPAATPSLRHSLLALTLATLLAPAHARSGDEFKERSVIGKWKLVAVLDFASIASLDEADAKRLLGKHVTISETMVQVDREVCDAPDFWAERVVPERHLSEKLHASAQRLKLPNPATVVEVGCTEVYIRTPDQLVVLWGGALFDAVRIGAEPRPKPASVAAPKRAAGNGDAPAVPRQRAPAAQRKEGEPGAAFGLIF